MLKEYIAKKANIILQNKQERCLVKQTQVLVPKIEWTMSGANVIIILLLGRGIRNVKNVNSGRWKKSKLENVHAFSSCPCGRDLKPHDLDLRLKRSSTLAVSINHRVSGKWYCISTANLDCWGLIVWKFGDSNR